MKGELIERIVKVHVFRFEDGTEIDADIIKRFLDDAYQFEDTIGEEGNITDGYLYFFSKDDKKLEKVLLDMNVIRLSPNHKWWNEDIRKENKETYNDYAYWLGNGYHEFVKKFWDYMNRV